MPPTPDRGRARALAAALRALPVEIAATSVETRSIPIPSYPDEPRPSSIVTLSGADHHGFGEHVGWTTGVHRTFQKTAPTNVPTGATSLGAFERVLRERVAEPYERAALEAAAIDLALRQSGRTVGQLIGAAPQATRYVISFTPGRDPAADLRTTIGGNPKLEAKIDVAAGWDATTFERLAESGRVAVLDWKRAGGPDQHLLAHRLLPGALLEDPGADPLAAAPAIEDRRSVDAPFTHARALDEHPAPFAANIKPARMGGVLEALDAVARCASRGVVVYFGGMFELGVGRRQLLALASLLCPDGPNDIAPIPRDRRPRSRPDRLHPGGSAGFGAAPAA